MLLHFEHFVARHGEVAALAIVENLERFEGARSLCVLSLEERWQRLMQGAAQPAMAA